MSKPLEDALGKVLRLPVHKQAVAAEQLAQRDAAPCALLPFERTAVREALARAAQGEFADEADVDAALWRRWI